jgi:hypothetical protein
MLNVVGLFAAGSPEDSAVVSEGDPSRQPLRKPRLLEEGTDAVVVVVAAAAAVALEEAGEADSATAVAAVATEAEEGVTEGIVGALEVTGVVVDSVEVRLEIVHCCKPWTALGGTIERAG